MTNKMKQSVKMDTIPFSGIRKVFEAAGKLEKEGKEINLTKKEYDTLLLFARNPGNVSGGSNLEIIRAV